MKIEHSIKERIRHLTYWSRKTIGGDSFDIGYLMRRIEGTTIEFDRINALVGGDAQVSDPYGTSTRHRAHAAQSYLAEANRNLGEGRLLTTLHLLHTADRELLACDLAKAQSIAVALRAEAINWGARDIIALLDESKAAEFPGREIECILDAIARRDDYFEANYVQILTRRHQFRQMSLLISISLIIFVVLCWRGFFNDPHLSDMTLIYAAVLFGIVGGCVSACWSLLRSGLTIATIAVQQSIAYPISFKAPTGAFAAWAAVALFHTQIASNPDHVLVFLIAFSAGFGIDRLALLIAFCIRFAIDRLTKSSNRISR